MSDEDKTWKCPYCDTIIVVCDKAGVKTLESLSHARDDFCRRLQKSLGFGEIWIRVFDDNYAIMWKTDQKKDIHTAMKISVANPMNLQPVIHAFKLEYERGK